MATYFVTGAAGFVGRHLLPRLAADGNEVFALYRGDRTPGEVRGVRWLKGDLLERRTYEAALGKADYVVHLASLLSARRTEDFLRSNVDGTAMLLKTCQGISAPLKRFIHMSSIAAVGSNQEGRLLDEASPCSPESEYGRSKYLAEQVVRSYSNALPVVTLRPGFIYGRGDLRGLKMLRSLGDPVSWLWMSRIRSLCLCHVDDVARSCLLSAEKNPASGEVFVISDPDVKTWEDVWRALGEAFKLLLENGAFAGNYRGRPFRGIASWLESAASKTARASYWACDPSKAQRMLGFRTGTTFSQGACDAISWYIGQGLLSDEDLHRIWESENRT